MHCWDLNAAHNGENGVSAAVVSFDVTVYNEQSQKSFGELLHDSFRFKDER